MTVPLLLHGSWLPDSQSPFLGQFLLWGEQPESTLKVPVGQHPRALVGVSLASRLRQLLGEDFSDRLTGRYRLSSAAIWLPSQAGVPLPSPELALDSPARSVGWGRWQVPVGAIAAEALPFLPQHLTSLVEQTAVGADLRFWREFVQRLQQLLRRGDYLPVLGQEPRAQQRSRTGEYRQSWAFLPEPFEGLLAALLPAAPPVLTAFAAPAHLKARPKFPRLETLLRQFAVTYLHEHLRQLNPPQTLERELDRGGLSHYLGSYLGSPSYQPRHSDDDAYAWHDWLRPLFDRPSPSPLQLQFQLREPEPEADYWRLEFWLAWEGDRWSLADFWQQESLREQLQRCLGDDPIDRICSELLRATDQFPSLWRALRHEEPEELPLSTPAVLELLAGPAQKLQAAGFALLVPSWCTPAGRKRLRAKLVARSMNAPDKSRSYFDSNSLFQFEPQLELDGQAISRQEWEELVASKQSLVRFRGRWVSLDLDDGQQLLDYWQRQGWDQVQDFGLTALMRQSADLEEVEFDFDEVPSLSDLWTRLQEPSRLELRPEPPGLQAQLRPYQQRGLSWLVYLESLGLNGCLADDMGLGKTIQVIARLLAEREGGDRPAPTLLIVPTSVIGNWQREIQRFGPQLQVLIHHGPGRCREAEAFQAQCAAVDVVLTAFGTARTDVELLCGREWQRVVVDEAQNIKNPQTAQTKAILRLPARHRLALTGTPVENRLLDLWSIFNFLQPGYLGNREQFRREFEGPIERGDDPERAERLRRLVQPFILRRLKTDQSIIADLPEKSEQKIYCNLTREQAALYQAIVKDSARQLEEAEGMQRRGLMLATLLKLKQVCNHPRQFLQDGSEFTAKRSHKLERLLEMVEEVVSEGQSLLIFSQFTDLGGSLHQWFREHTPYRNFYLHGGTPRAKREQMVTEFQDDSQGPAVFVLSIKAGGVGLNLTRANHVFHFDRWWNPAVEDQATDRAFRIGQTRSVFVHKFVTLGTLEERIDQMIEDKKGLAGQIIGSDEAWLTELDNRAFQSLIALDRNAVLE